MAKAAKKKKSSRVSSSKSSNDSIFSTVSRIVRSEEFPRAVAVCMFILAIFCFVAFVSFFITWAEDSTVLDNLSAAGILSGEQPTGNWTGPFGAFLAFVTIRNTFGIGSFGIILILVLFALRLFKVEFNDFSKWLVSSFIIMLWLSCIFGYVVVAVGQNDMEMFAGVVGVGINRMLCSFMGSFGAALVHITFTIVIPMVLWGVKYLWVSKAVKQVKENISQHRQTEPEEDAEKEPAKETDPVEVSWQEEKKEKPKGIVADMFARKGKVRGELSQQAIEAATQFTVRDLNETEQNESEENVTPEETIPQETPVEAVPEKIIFDISKEESAPEPKEDKKEDVSFTVRNMNEEAAVANESAGVQDVNNPAEDVEDREHLGVEEDFDPYRTLSFYQFPKTDFLPDYAEKNIPVTRQELIANKDRITTTLKNYNIAITSIEATPGPTVTLYEIVPAPGVRISKIKSLGDDIALSLAAMGIRIIAPIPGKGTIGIEVPNRNPQIVSMKSMLESAKFKESKYELPVAIGKTISNEPFVADLAKMPHLLMAGATGQGKSVGLNAIITSLLYKKHPADLKLVLVDPKKVELSLYSRLEKHYLAKIPDGNEAIITDVSNVVKTLNSLCVEMDTRYDLLKQAECKKITEYNKKFKERRLNPEKGHKYMPYIVLVVDEFADLIMTAGKKVEKPICRLAQLARAVGIHLIIATQRPSVNIITGTIKANFPARIAFKVSSGVDSRTILDQTGAEQLIGRGDMLISLGNQFERLQCALIDTEEIEEIARFIGDQQGYLECYELPEAPDEEGEGKEESSEVESTRIDSKFEEAARLILQTQQGSTSMLQRHLELGYNRAGRIMDQMQKFGIVGPFCGSKSRKVLIHTEAELDEILARILPNRQ